MRIISQDGEYDFPYEISTVRMCVGNDDKHYWIAVNSNCIDSYWNFAVYSSKQKAEKVIEMLREQYSRLQVVKILASGTFEHMEKSLSKDEFLECNLKYREMNIFQFPQDEDVEV